MQKTLLREYGKDAVAKVSFVCKTGEGLDVYKRQVLEWGSSDRWSADLVRLCYFLGWKSGLRCHGGGIHLLFLSSVKDFYCWKCYEPSDLSGISGRG